MMMTDTLSTITTHNDHIARETIHSTSQDAISTAAAADNDDYDCTLAISSQPRVWQTVGRTDSAGGMLHVAEWTVACFLCLSVTRDDLDHDRLAASVNPSPRTSEYFPPLSLKTVFQCRILS